MAPAARVPALTDAALTDAALTETALTEKVLTETTLTETTLTETAGPDRRAASGVTIVVAALVVIGALRLGRDFALPVVVAILLTLLLGAPVRWLAARRVPDRVAAAIVVFGAVGTVVTAAALLAAPAMQWVTAAPRTLQKLETKIRRITAPFTVLQRSAERMQQATGAAAAAASNEVRMATPGIIERVSLESLAAIPVALAVIFLTYFLLANGPLFRRKLAGLLPGRNELTRREHLLTLIELTTSRFLVTIAVINLSVGVLTALALWALGVPSPFLWGGITAVLNFVPYVGPMTSVAVIGLASLASFDEPARALMPPAAFLLIHLVESNFFTPMLLGHRLPVNTVAIFVGLLLFGWMWGVPGAVLAVPLTVCVKLVCDHVPALAHVGALLDN